jgi:hypothetical protein
MAAVERNIVGTSTARSIKVRAGDRAAQFPVVVTTTNAAPLRVHHRASSGYHAKRVRSDGAQ